MCNTLGNSGLLRMCYTPLTWHQQACSISDCVLGGKRVAQLPPRVTFRVPLLNDDAQRLAACNALPNYCLLNWNSIQLPRDKLRILYVMLVPSVEKPIIMYYNSMVQHIWRGRWSTWKRSSTLSERAGQQTSPSMKIAQLQHPSCLQGKNFWHLTYGVFLQG